MFRSGDAHQPNLLTTVRDACCSISTTDRSFGSSSTARSAGCESQRARSCAGITSSPSTSAQQACLCQMSRGLKSQRSTALVEAVQWRRRNSTPSISRQSVRISFRPDRTPTSDPRPVPERARHIHELMIDQSLWLQFKKIMMGSREHNASSRAHPSGQSVSKGVSQSVGQ